MDRASRNFITAALRQVGVPQERILTALEVLQGGNGRTNGSPRKEARPLLVSQADAARLLSVNRLTVRNMTQRGILHPVILLASESASTEAKSRPLVRYAVAELESLAAGAIPKTPAE